MGKYFKLKGSDYRFSKAFGESPGSEFSFIWVNLKGQMNLFTRGFCNKPF